MIQGWVVWATGGFPDKELPFYWRLGLLIVEHAEHNIIYHYWVEYNIFQTSGWLIMQYIVIALQHSLEVLAVTNHK